MSSLSLGGVSLTTPARFNPPHLGLTAQHEKTVISQQVRAALELADSQDARRCLFVCIVWVRSIRQLATKHIQ